MVISVIVPAFNEERFISRCIHSLLKQKFAPNYEIIVVDNNSTDKTVEIASRFDIKIIKEKRQSVGYAKNAGAGVALGDILVFVDADCITPEDYIERIYSISLSHPKIDAFGGSYVYYDSGYLLRFITDKLSYFYFYFLFIKIIFGFQSMSGGNMIVRKSAFKKVNGFQQQIKDIIYPEDMEFSLRLSRVGCNVGYFADLKIETSGRRIKRSPIKDSVKRLYYAISLLTRHDTANKFK